MGRQRGGWKPLQIGAPRRKEKAMVRSGWMPLLAMSLAALSGTARAAMQLSPGQELIYTGTVGWKQSVSGGPPETF